MARLPGASRKGVKTVAGAVLLALGAATWNQSGVYKDELTLFGHSAAVNPDSWAANYYAGVEFLEVRQFGQAEAHLSHALELKPGHPGVLLSLGEVLRLRGRNAEAVESYRSSLEIKPRNAPAYAGLGTALYGLERYVEAVEALERSVSLRLDESIAGPAHQLLGHSLEALERDREAARHYERAMEIDPGDAGLIERLAQMRFRQKHYREALRLYQKRLVIGRVSARVHANVGNTLYYLNRPEEAQRSFERALELEPELEMARNGLRRVREFQNSARIQGPSR